MSKKIFQYNSNIAEEKTIDVLRKICYTEHVIKHYEWCIHFLESPSNILHIKLNGEDSKE